MSAILSQPILGQQVSQQIEAIPLPIGISSYLGLVYRKNHLNVIVPSQPNYPLNRNGVRITVIQQPLRAQISTPQTRLGRYIRPAPVVRLEVSLESNPEQC